MGELTKEEQEKIAESLALPSPESELSEEDKLEVLKQLKVLK